MTDQTFKPTITVSPTVRQLLYALTAVGSLAATYLGAKGIIHGDEIAAWSGWVTLVSSLAVSKTDTSRPVKKRGAKHAAAVPAPAPTDVPAPAPTDDTVERTPEGLPIV